MTAPTKHVAIGIASLLSSLVCAPACKTAPTSPTAELSRLPTCSGRMAVTALAPDWNEFPMFVESTDAIDVPEASDPEAGIVVKDIHVGRFRMRFAQQHGSQLGPLRILERDCPDAPLTVKLEWRGGTVALRRRGENYVVARSASDTAMESAMLSFVWIPYAARKTAADAGAGER